MGFWVSGVRPRVWNSGFRVQGSGLRVQGFEFRVEGSQAPWFRVDGLSFRVQRSGCRVREAGQTRSPRRPGRVLVRVRVVRRALR